MHSFPPPRCARCSLDDGVGGRWLLIDCWPPTDHVVVIIKKKKKKEEEEEVERKRNVNICVVIY